MSAAVAFDFEAMTERAVPLDEAVRASGAGLFCWFDLDGGDPDEAEAVLRGLGVDDRDGSSAGPDGELVRVAIAAASLSESRLSLTPVELVLGRSFVVSLCPGEPEFLRRVRATYRRDFLEFARSPGFLIYELFDHLTASYKGATRGLGLVVCGLQAEIRRGVDEAVFDRVASASIDLASLRRAVLAAREALSELATRHSTAVPDTTRPYLEKLVGTLERIGVDLTVERETLAEAMNLSLAIVSHRTNQVVNRLTAVSLVFLPLTFLCGVYGMNFEFLPEVKWRYGYAFFWATAAIVAASTLAFMKRQGWW